MKGVMIMRIRSDYSKDYHAGILRADLRREKLQHSSSEYAKKQFQRKPYQIGGSENGCSGKNANED